MTDDRACASTASASVRQLRRAAATSTSTIAPGRVRLLPRPLGLRQDDAAAHHRRARDADAPARIVQDGRDISRAAAGRARLRHRVPVVRAVPEPHGRRQRRLRPRQPARCRAARSRRASPSCSTLVGLPEQRRRSIPAQLSGGQQQRIALARALATSPGLLLLDEPLSALDALERVRLRGEIRALQQRLGVTTIMVTHDQEEALSMADRIVVMNHGVIEQVGTPLRGLPRAGDAVRRRLRRQDQRARRRVRPGRRRCASAAAASPCEHGTDRRSATSSSTCGPRTCWSRPIARGRRPTSFDGAIEKIEFLGAYCLVRVHSPSSATSRSPSTCRSTTSPSRAWRVGSRAAARAAARADAGLRPRMSAPCRRRCRCAAARAVASASHWTDRDRARGAARWSSLALVAVPARCRWPRSSSRACRTATARFVGLANFASYFAHAGAAAVVLEQRLGVGAGHAITVPLAFIFAYALTRSCMPSRALFRDDRADAAPRAVAAVGDLVHLVVRQPGRRSRACCTALGFEKSTARPASSSAECYAIFPHALMILVTALPLADARLYEAAEALGTLDAGASSSPSRCRARSTA